MMAFSPTRHRSPHGDVSPAGGRILPVPNLRRGVFFWIVRAFRAAIRTEVDRAMADRRAALARRAPQVPAVSVPGDPLEARRVLHDLHVMEKLGMSDAAIAPYRARVAALGLTVPDASLRVRMPTDDDLIAIGVALGQCGLNLRHAEVIPFPVPANDHSDTSPPAA